MSVRVVQGFSAKTFTCKKDTIKLTLGADKDDVRAGAGDISDVLESLELHCTAADSSYVEAALLISPDGTDTRPFEFMVVSFTVKQDDIKVVLKASREDNEDEENGNTLKSLAIHAAAGEDKPIELTMQGAD